MTTNPNAELPRVIEPCEHMENMVNGLADGSLAGPARLYTKFHITTCPRCRTALAALQDVHARLNQLETAPDSENAEIPALTPEHREALDTGMTLVEQQRKSDATAG